MAHGKPRTTRLAGVTSTSCENEASARSAPYTEGDVAVATPSAPTLSVYDSFVRSESASSSLPTASVRWKRAASEAWSDFTGVVALWSLMSAVHRAIARPSSGDALSVVITTSVTPITVVPFVHCTGFGHGVSSCDVQVGIGCSTAPGPGGQAHERDARAATARLILKFGSCERTGPAVKSASDEAAAAAYIS